MYLGRPVTRRQAEQVAMINGAGSGRWPGHAFNGARRWPGHAFNGGDGGALGMYPWWPTGPWNGAGLGADAQLVCNTVGSVTDRMAIQNQLNRRGAGVVADGKICCGPNSRGGYTGETYNAITWWAGPGRGRLTMSPDRILALLSTRTAAALAAVHPADAVADWQDALGVSEDGCLGAETALALNIEVPGWQRMTTSAIQAALFPTVPPQDPIDTPPPPPIDVPSDPPGDDPGDPGDDPITDPITDPTTREAGGLSTAAKAGIAIGAIGLIGLVWAGSSRKTRRGR